MQSKKYQLVSARFDQTDDHEAIKKRLVANRDEIEAILKRVAIESLRLDLLKKKLVYGAEEGSEKYEAARIKIEKKIDEISKSVLRIDVVNSNEFAKLFHYFLGLTTESGELMEALLKWGATGELDRTNLTEEKGDLFWYLARAVKAIGTTFEKCMGANDRKLSIRYEGGYSDAKAMKRNLKKERDQLDKDTKK